eukprot:1932450-Rhodomonas_salina.5
MSVPQRERATRESARRERARREREGGRERQRETERDRDRHTDTQTDTGTESKKREGERERGREREGEVPAQSWTGRDWSRIGHAPAVGNRAISLNERSRNVRLEQCLRVAPYCSSVPCRNQMSTAKD